MSHWLDDAARGLADGTHSRREVLRRGGLVAAGGFLASVGRTGTALGAEGDCGGEPYNKLFERCCEGGERPHICPKTDRCCGSRCCAPNAACCDEHRCYHPAKHKCCATHGFRGQRPWLCKPHQHCCGQYAPGTDVSPGCFSPATNTCCQGRSHGGIYPSHSECCEGVGYDPATQCCVSGEVVAKCNGNCCQPFQVCCNGRCCGQSEVCCAGQCVASSDCCSGQVCAEGEVCCGGTTCCAADECNPNGVCGPNCCSDFVGPGVCCPGDCSNSSQYTPGMSSTTCCPNAGGPGGNAICSDAPAQGVTITGCCKDGYPGCVCTGGTCCAGPTFPTCHSDGSCS